MKSIFLLLFTASFLHAAFPKWIQIPAATEARPTDAAAWVLHDSLNIVQESGTSIAYRYRQVVMPLSEAGVKATSCDFQFSVGAEKLVSARAWAISPDGSKYRAFGGDEFFVVSAEVSSWMWDPRKRVIFNPERYLEPGWIFAWEVEVKSEFGLFDFRWSPQATLPVKYATLEVIPAADGDVKWKALSENVPTPIHGNSPHALSWIFSNLPALKTNVPDQLERNRPEVGVYLLSPETPLESKSWSNFVKLVRTEIEPQIVATPGIAAEAKRLEGSGDLWQRIEPICRFVQKEVAYLLVEIDEDSMAGMRPHAANEVFENRYGDCKDKATLLCTMLHSVGVDARVMLVNNGAPRQTFADWPSLGFNHAIVAIRETEPVPAGWTTIQAGSATYALFDPTDDRVPLGLVPISDVNGLGLVLAPDVTAPVLIPSIPAIGESDGVKMSVALQPNGSCVVDLEESRAGLRAAASINRDETVTQNERTAELEKRIHERTPLISNLVWESHSDAPHHRWTRKAHFTAQFLGKLLSGGGMYVPTDFLSVIPRLETWEDGVDGWVTIAPETNRRELRMSFPAGWSVTESPSDWSIKTPAGSASVHYQPDGADLLETFRLEVVGGSLDRPAYFELRKLLSAATAAERRPVVLHHPLAPATAAPGPVASVTAHL